MIKLTELESKLWAHQREALRRFKKKQGYGLFFEMGAGKTLTAIACYIYLAEQNKEHLRTLILCPKAMVRTWVKELAAVGLGDRTLELTGSTANKIRQIKTNLNANIIVTNHDALKQFNFSDFIKRVKLDMLIVDELHRFKSYNSVSSKALHDLTKTTYRLGLTGTPVTNTEEDLWSQIRFINPEAVPANFHVWHKTYFYNANADKPWAKWPDYRPRPDTFQYFHDLLHTNGMVVKKKDVLDLPPLTRITQHVELHEKIAKHYREMEKSFVTMLQTEDGTEAVTADLIITRMLRLQQICCGILKTEEEEHLVETAKKEALRELVEQILAQGQKVVIWSNFNKGIEAIQQTLFSLTGIYYCKIVGGQGADERQKNIDDFQTNSKYQVMIANQAAGGVGIGLQAASYMIYYSKDFSLEKDLQSEARAYRGGSNIHKNITRIDLVTKDTIEEVIHEALSNKLKLSDLITTVKEKYGK